MKWQQGATHMKRSPLKFILAVLGLAVAPASALGQSSLDVGELPKSTMFYFDWHGTPSGEARKANSLLALWDDADLAPVRAAMIQEMMRSSAESQKMKAPLTRDELLQYAALLDNEFVFGYMGNPHAPKTSGTAHESQTNKTNKWNGMFLVYDRSGKETTLAKLLLRMRMNEKESPKISATTIAGISAIKIERKSGTSYWAEEGKYEISASEPMVFEQILKWTKHETPEPARMAKTAAYREAGDLLKGGVADFFFHFTSTQDMDWETSVGGFRLRPLIESLKLDALHSIAG